jgi:hypothetical protein
MGVGQSIELNSDYNTLLVKYKYCLTSNHFPKQTCTNDIIAELNSLDVYYSPFATYKAPFLKMTHKKIMAYRDLLINNQ